jgi:hypothetical protein
VSLTPYRTDTGSKFVHLHLYTNVDFEKLRGAQRAMEAAGIPEAVRR